MDFRVRSLGSSMPGNASYTGGANGKLRIKTENSLEIKPGISGGQHVSSGRSLGDGNAREFAKRAENAVEAISGLRQRQLALAEEASKIADPERQAQMEAENQTLQDEISRIQGSATFQGENVLAGKTLVMDDKAVALANLTSLADDPGVDLSNQDSAVEAVAALTESLLSTRYASAGTSAAAAKSATDTAPVNAEIVDIQQVRSDPIRDPNKAEDLARNIASELRARERDTPTESLLAHELNPERSKELLE